MTHVYLANEILSLSSLVPASVLLLLRAYKQDFLYGNLMADMIIGKKYLPDELNSHTWEMACKLLESAFTGHEKAFAYGFFCHLAADTVAHEALTDDMRNIGHTWTEIKADSMIDKIFWVQSVSISRSVQRRNDRILKHFLKSFIFSFSTNKIIYKSLIVLSFFNHRKRYGIDRNRLEPLYDESITRMIDILSYTASSSVLEKKAL